MVNFINRFGPFAPAQEMALRPHNMRAVALSAMSYGHRSSKAVSVASDIIAVTSCVYDLRDMIGANYQNVMPNLAIMADLSKHITRPSNEDILRSIRDGVDIGLTGKVRDMAMLIGRVHSYFDSKPKTLYEHDGTPLFEGAFDCGYTYPEFEQRLKSLREFCLDRALFVSQENIPEATTTFDDIRDIVHRINNSPLHIARRREISCEMDITERAIRANIALAMSHTRAFSIFNNLIANAYIHGKQESRISVSFGARMDPLEIEFIVRNEGKGIPETYFEQTDNGLIRLFDLEIRKDRIPEGAAEVWDSVGIQNGTISVVSETNAVTEFAVRLPAVVK